MTEGRTRTVSWSPWQESSHTDHTKSGLEYLEALRDGAVAPPPVFHTIDFRLVAVAAGTATYEFTPSEMHYNTIGTVHGGIASTLLDSAMGSAVHSIQRPNFGHTTLELKVNLVRAITSDSGTLQAVGKVVHSGRSTATAEASLLDYRGRLFAHSTTTCLIFPIPAKAS